MDRLLLPDHTDCIIDLTDCISASILDMTCHKSTVSFFSQFFNISDKFARRSYIVKKLTEQKLVLEETLRKSSDWTAIRCMQKTISCLCTAKFLAKSTLIF